MNPFSLNSTMGSSWRVNEDDVVNTKTVLRDLGYYKPPAHGINDWTEDAMFDGIKSFQKDYGLQVDGVMKPGGPTEEKINDVILAAGRREPNVGRSSRVPSRDRGPDGQPRIKQPPWGSTKDTDGRVWKDNQELQKRPGIFGLPDWFPSGNSKSR